MGAEWYYFGGSFTGVGETMRAEGDSLFGRQFCSCTCSCSACNMAMVLPLVCNMWSQEEPGGARRGPGGARRSQEEPRRSQDEPRRSQEEPGDARMSQWGLGGARKSQGANGAQDEFCQVLLRLGARGGPGGAQGERGGAIIRGPGGPG